MNGAGHVRAPTATIGHLDDDLLVVEVVGRFGPASVLRLLRDLPAGQACIVLDLAAVPELDARALAAIVAVRRRTRARGTRVVLWHLRAQPLQLLHDRHVHHLVEVAVGPLEEWLVEHPAAITSAS